MVTLDIPPKIFNSVMNFGYFFGNDASLMHPIIFSENLFDTKEVVSFEMMNFRLDIFDDMEKELIKHSPNFDKVAECDCNYKGLLIFGKARLDITNVKGIYLEFSGLPDSFGKEYHGRDDIVTNIRGEKTYYTRPCKIKKGDYILLVGGNSSFSHHYAECYLVADKDAIATITFSLDEYILVDAHDEDSEFIFSKKQTRYDYRNSKPRPDILEKFTNVPSKLFDADFMRDYFEAAVAFRDEES